MLFWQCMVRISIIKILVFSLMALSTPVVANYEAEDAVRYQSLLTRLQPRLAANKAFHMAQMFIRESKACDLNWRLLVSIAYNESSLGMYRVNDKSKDYGLMQINQKNLQAFKTNTKKAINNDVVSVRLACRILNEHRKILNNHDDLWIGTYRSGLNIKNKRIMKSAVAYKKIITKTMNRISVYESEQ